GKLGGALQKADERVLLDQIHRDDRRLAVMRPEPSEGTTWVWKAASIWLGLTSAQRGNGTEYRRHCNAEEIQYQLTGRRTLVTQRGTLELEPGDFVKAPSGCAFTSIHSEPCSWLTMFSTKPLPRVAEPTRIGEPRTAAQLDELRKVAA
ncbi:MAG TPA: hypothetical protein VF157_13250, partial [Chloroflexota bacterium]